MPLRYVEAAKVANEEVKGRVKRRHSGDHFGVALANKMPKTDGRTGQFAALRRPRRPRSLPAHRPGDPVAR